MPSSKISRAFSESLVPPMSLTWPTVPTRPTRRPSRNTGVSTAMSNRWPAQSHGSLVTSTSPGTSVSGGYFCQQRLHGARQAEIEHRHGARRMHQRLALGVEQLAGEILRFRDDQRERRADHGEPHLVHHGDEPAPHDLERDRIGLDARHRLGERRARRDQRLRRRRDADRKPQVEIARRPAGCRRAARRWSPRAPRRWPGLRCGRRARARSGRRPRLRRSRSPNQTWRAPLRFCGAAAPRLVQRQFGRRPEHAHAEADRLDRGLAVERGVAPGIDVREGGADRAERGLVDRARRQRHVDLVHLPDEAHVGAALDRDLRARDAGLGEQRAPFGLELAQDRVDRGRVKAVARCAPDTSARARSSAARRGSRGTRRRPRPAE